MSEKEEEELTRFMYTYRWTVTLRMRDLHKGLWGSRSRRVKLYGFVEAGKSTWGFVWTYIYIYKCAQARRTLPTDNNFRPAAHASTISISLPFLSILFSHHFPFIYTHTFRSSFRHSAQRQKPFLVYTLSSPTFLSFSLTINLCFLILTQCIYSTTPFLFPLTAEIRFSQLRIVIFIQPISFSSLQRSIIVLFIYIHIEIYKNIYMGKEEKEEKGYEKKKKITFQRNLFL